MFVAFLVLIQGPDIWGASRSSRFSQRSSKALQRKQPPAAVTTDNQRLALVIGNSAYDRMPQELQPLSNPVNDASDIAAVLEDLQFKVTLLKNATLQQMEDTIHQFGSQLRADSVVLVYYSGHGMQVKGENYIIPVDAEFNREDQIARRSILISELLEKIEIAGTKLVFLDACRNNPFLSKGKKGKVRGGLGKMNAPTGSLLVYSTDPDNTAEDGEGRNSPFTENLLAHMTTPGVDVQIMLRSVRAGVQAATGQKQTPWDLSSLTGTFYFAPGEADQPVRVRPQTTSPETTSPETTSPETTSPDTELAELEADVDMLMQMPILPTDGGDDSAADIWVRKRAPVRLKAWKRAANDGHAGAQLLVGLHLIQAKDPKTGFPWLLKAAEQDNPLAQFIVGFFYVEGKSIAQNNKKGFQWTYKSAIQGNKYAQFLLAGLYQSGLGVKQDKALAIEWLRKATAQGLAAAKEALANLETAQSPQQSSEPADNQDTSDNSQPSDTNTPTRDNQDATAYADEERDWGVSPTKRLKSGEYHGHTPTDIPDGKMITTVKLVELIREHGSKVILIDALANEHAKTIQGAHRLPESGRGGGFTDSTQQKLFRDLMELSGGKVHTPIVVFCGGPMCWLSYNAVLRIVRSGYKQVFWYRGGIEAWEAAGLPMDPG